MISKSIALILRVAQLLCAIAIMAVMGHVLSTSYYNTIPRVSGNAAEVNFTMFLSVFTTLCLLFLFPASWKYFENPNIFKAATVVDGLNLIFYLCDGIALAAALQVHSCNNPVYTLGNRITQTSPDTKTRCREAQAATAFVWILFLLFIVTTGFSLSMWNEDFNLGSSTGVGHRFSRNRRGAQGAEEEGRDDEDAGSRRYDMAEVSGGPMVADLDEPPRAYGRNRRDQAEMGVSGGHWSADDDTDAGIGGDDGGYGSGRRRDRVVNVPVGGHEFADDPEFRR